MAGFAYVLSGFGYREGDYSINHYYSKLSDKLGNPVRVGFFTFDIENEELLGSFDRAAASAMDNAVDKYFKGNKKDEALIHGIDVDGLRRRDGFIMINSPGYASMRRLSLKQKTGNMLINGMIPVKNVPEFLIEFELGSVFSDARYSNALFYPSEEKFHENFLSDFKLPPRAMETSDAPRIDWESIL